MRRPSTKSGIATPCERIRSPLGQKEGRGPRRQKGRQLGLGLRHGRLKAVGVEEGGGGRVGAEVGHRVKSAAAATLLAASSPRRIASSRRANSAETPMPWAVVKRPSVTTRSSLTRAPRSWERNFSAG